MIGWSVVRAWARRSARLRALARWAGPHHRALRAIERDHPGRLLQPSADTRSDRYPAIFDHVAAQLARHPAPSLLSYGCSTGEELVALQRRLPHARIVGADINPRSLRIARQRLRQQGMAKVELVRAADPADLSSRPFDAVLCLAVLRHGDLLARHAPSCAALLPFARAEAVVAALAERVAPGGLLALWCTQFRFTDMAASAAFEPVMDDARDEYFNHPLYGPDDRRLDGARCRTAVFRRR